MLDRAPVTLSTLRTREDLFYRVVNIVGVVQFEDKQDVPANTRCVQCLSNLLLGECEQEFVSGCHELNPLKI